MKCKSQQTIMTTDRLRFAIRNPMLALSYAFGKRYPLQESGNRKQRIYKDYDEYIRHQSSKLRLFNKHDFAEYEKELQDSLHDRIMPFGICRMSVLCLGAGFGNEVKAFIDAGCFAVGIDLAPGNNNKHVLYGDFHALQFADSSIDAIYSNSLDHVYDMAAVMQEIRRVLKDDGFLMIDTPKGFTEGYRMSRWDTLQCSTSASFINLISSYGFEAIRRESITLPFDGESALFTRSR